MCVLSQQHAYESRLKYQDVLSPVADTSITDTKASKSCLTSHTCNVHGVICDWVLSGKKTLHCMQFGFPNSGFPDMLQWSWELFIVEQQL
jgi:hypothetical protein